MSEVTIFKFRNRTNACKQEMISEICLRHPPKRNFQMFEQKHLFPQLFSFPPAVSGCIALWENAGAARSETTACFDSLLFLQREHIRTAYTLKGFTFKTPVLLFRKQRVSTLFAQTLKFLPESPRPWTVGRREWPASVPRDSGSTVPEPHCDRHKDVHSVVCVCV